MTTEGLDLKTAVLALDGDCIAASLGTSDGDVQAHHVITQQQLREQALNAYLWDPSNGAAVCYRHHRRHHNRTEPLVQAFLPQRCRDFAATHELGRLLDRYYPNREDAAG